MVRGVATKAAAGAATVALVAVGLAFVPAGAQPADAGEFQLVARDLGVAHPPGYPLYTLAAHGFARIVLGNAPATDPGWPWAVNAFSMLLAVATLAVVARAAARLGGTWVAGAVAVALLAFAPTFAAQALVANIRMATALFTALLLGLTLAWLAGADRDGAPPRRPLVALAFVLALAAGHHPTLAALALPLGAALIARRPALLRDARLVGAGLAAAVAGLAPLAYLPLRAAQGAPLAPADLATAGGVWRHVTAAGFRGDMLAITGTTDLADRLHVLANIVTLQFGPAALVLSAIGSVWLVARRRAAATAVVGTALVVGWLAMTYRAPQTMEYLLPAYVAMAIAAGAGAAVVLHGLRALSLSREWQPGSPGGVSRRRRTDGVGPQLACLALLVVALRGRADTLALARAAVPDLAAVTRLASEPSCLGADASVFASWHYATPLWLAGRRAPTDAGTPADAPYATAAGAPIVYVHPDFATGDPIGETWRQRLTAAALVGPAVATNRPREVIDADLALQGLSGTPFWVHGAGAPLSGRCSTLHRFTGLQYADLGGGAERWQLRQADLEPGRVGVDGLGLDVYLTVTADGKPAADDLVAFAQLVDLDSGAVAGQADRPLGHDALAADAATSAYTVRLPLAPFRGLDVRHRLAVDVGLYRAEPGGPRRLAVAGVRYAAPAPGAPNPLRPADGGVVADGTAARLVVASGTLTAVLARAAGPAAPANAIPFGNAMTLLAASVHRTATDLVVDLTWRADGRAWASDYTVSVQAAADDGSWRAQHDGTPALGAIPTLKWLPGMVIRDRHRIPLPSDASEGGAGGGGQGDRTGADLGPVTVTVGVYDAFSLEPLPVTDGERVRRGQGQRAVVYP